MLFYAGTPGQQMPGSQDSKRAILCQDAGLVGVQFNAPLDTV